MNPPELIAEGRHLNLVQRDGWEYVTRTRATGVAAIFAVTDDDEVVLVEQHRPPVGENVIELPAGLVGDEDGHETETVRRAAERELLEETGFEASAWSHLFTCVSSGGVSDEIVTVFEARGLSRRHAGGGVDGEAITVHLVPRPDAWNWLDTMQDRGRHVDARVFAGLAVAAKPRPNRPGGG